MELQGSTSSAPFWVTALADAEDLSDKAVERLIPVLEHYEEFIKRVFMHYAAGSPVTNSQFGIHHQEFRTFVKDSGLVQKPNLTSLHLDQMFQAVNLIHPFGGGERILNVQQFVHLLLRISTKKYQLKRTKAIQKLMDLLKRRVHYMKEDENFVDVFYCAEVQKVIQKHHRALCKLFKHFSATSLVNQSFDEQMEMDVDEFVGMFRRAEMITKGITQSGLRQAYYMVSVDDILKAGDVGDAATVHHTYEQFVQAICRVFYGRRGGRPNSTTAGMFSTFLEEIEGALFMELRRTLISKKDRRYPKTWKVLKRPPRREKAKGDSELVLADDEKGELELEMARKEAAKVIDFREKLKGTRTRRLHRGEKNLETDMMYLSEIATEAVADGGAYETIYEEGTAPCMDASTWVYTSDLRARMGVRDSLSVLFSDISFDDSPLAEEIRYRVQKPDGRTYLDMYGPRIFSSEQPKVDDAAEIVDDTSKPFIKPTNREAVDPKRYTRRYAISNKTTRLVEMQYKSTLNRIRYLVTRWRSIIQGRKHVAACLSSIHRILESAVVTDFYHFWCQRVEEKKRAQRRAAKVAAEKSKDKRGGDGEPGPGQKAGRPGRYMLSYDELEEEEEGPDESVTGAEKKKKSVKLADATAEYAPLDIVLKPADRELLFYSGARKTRVLQHFVTEISDMRKPHISVRLPKEDKQKTAEREKERRKKVIKQLQTQSAPDIGRSPKPVSRALQRLIDAQINDSALTGTALSISTDLNDTAVSQTASQSHLSSGSYLSEEPVASRFVRTEMLDHQVRQTFKMWPSQTNVASSPLFAKARLADEMEEYHLTQSLAAVGITKGSIASLSMDIDDPAEKKPAPRSPPVWPQCRPSTAIGLRKGSGNSHLGPAGTAPGNMTAKLQKMTQPVKNKDGGNLVKMLEENLTELNKNTIVSQGKGGEHVDLEEVDLSESPSRLYLGTDRKTDCSVVAGLEVAISGDTSATNQMAESGLDSKFGTAVAAQTHNPNASSYRSTRITQKTKAPLPQIMEQGPQ